MFATYTTLIAARKRKATAQWWFCMYAQIEVVHQLGHIQIECDVLHVTWTCRELFHGSDMTNIRE